MKITTIGLTEEEMQERDYRGMYAIEIDDEKVFEVWDGEPEDSNLSRDFSAVYGIPDLLQKAYDAGKRGEDLTFEEREVDTY